MFQNGKPYEVFYLAIETRVNATVLADPLERLHYSCIGLLRSADRKSGKLRERQAEAGAMADFTNLILLVGASLGAMAFGVLSAYAMLRGAFALMRPAGRRQAVQTSTETARSAV